MKKNDREMTGVLYGRVQEFWVRKHIIITTRSIAVVLYRLCRIPVLPINEFFCLGGRNEIFRKNIGNLWKHTVKSRL